MRLTYYKFPENTPENVLLQNGCEIILVTGDSVHSETIPENKRPLVSRIERVLSCSVKTAKMLLKQYGGCAWTEHFERDGTLFEVSDIKCTGNNSFFNYNRHL